MPAPVKTRLSVKFRRNAILMAAISSTWATPSLSATINVSGACTLIKAIRSANQDPTEVDCPDGDAAGVDTIVLQNSSVHTLTAIYKYFDGPNGLPPISSSITIEGNGSTITREIQSPLFRIFHVNANDGSLTLKDLTVSFGETPAPYSGGGIFNAGTLSLVNTTLENNKANRSGGAVEVQSGNASLTGCHLRLNYAGGHGGALHSQGASTVSIINSQVQDNTADGLGGGVSNDSSHLTISDTTISGNTSGGVANGGGGLFDFQGNVTLNRSTVSQNIARTGTGGGIGLNSSTAVFNNSTISGNTAGLAGGVEAFSSNTTFNNCTVFENRTTNTSLTQDGNLTVYNGIATVSNSIIANAVGGPDCFTHGTGGIIMAGHNFFGDASCIDPDAERGDPNLDPLANNGGPTKTHALHTGSRAIDAGDPAKCAIDALQNVDQRGYARVSGPRCDIGAYELDQTSFFVIPAPGGKTIIFGL